MDDDGAGGEDGAFDIQLKFRPTEGLLEACAADPIAMPGSYIANAGETPRELMRDAVEAAMRRRYEKKVPIFHERDASGNKVTHGGAVSTATATTTQTTTKKDVDLYSTPQTSILKPEKRACIRTKHFVVKIHDLFLV